MAMLPSVFKAEDNRGPGNDAMPAGWYIAEAVRSELKNSKKGGKYLSFMFNVLEPEEHANRKVFTNINLVNASTVAVEIGEKTLASLMDACEVEETEDTVDLHNIPIYIKLSVKAGDANWPERNEIKDYLSISRWEEKYGEESVKEFDEDGIPF
jgi:hypothetical protein